MTNNQSQNKVKKVVTPETQEGFKNPAEKEVDIKREDRLIGAICYAPFGFIAPFAVKRSSNFLSIHIKQGAIIFLTFLLLIMLLPLGLMGILFLVYLGLAGFPAYKAFGGHAFQYKFLNIIISKITNITTKRKIK